MKKIFMVVALFALTMNAQAQLGNLFNKIKSVVSSSTTTETTTSAAETTSAATSSSTASSIATAISSTAASSLLTGDVTSALKNVLGDLVAECVPLSEATINGAWNYNGASCVLESNEALANIGGSIAAGKIEEKLDGYLAMVGVAPGSCTFAFNEDNTCALAVNGREISGTYQLNAETKTVDFVFYNYLSMTAHVSYNLSELNLVFDADKLLELFKKVTSVVSSNSGNISSLLGSAAQQSTAATTAAASTATLSTISALLDSYTGMMLGMKLKK